MKSLIEVLVITTCFLIVYNSYTVLNMEVQLSKHIKAEEEFMLKVTKVIKTEESNESVVQCVY